MSDGPRLGEIPVVVNPLLPPGTMFLVSQELMMPFPKLEPFELDHEMGTAAVAFRYLPLVMPDPRKLIVLSNILEAEKDVDRRWRRRERKLVSCKQHEKAQRRLDYASNARRRKRWTELARRNGK